MGEKRQRQQQEQQQELQVQQQQQQQQPNMVQPPVSVSYDVLPSVLVKPPKTNSERSCGSFDVAKMLAEDSPILSSMDASLQAVSFPPSNPQSPFQPFGSNPESPSPNVGAQDHHMHMLAEFGHHKRGGGTAPVQEPARLYDVPTPPILASPDLTDEDASPSKQRIVHSTGIGGESKGAQVSSSPDGAGSIHTF
jgi:hypothetical protein